jgi:tetratricopeptide (TPR) repeat protein
MSRKQAPLRAHRSRVREKPPAAAGQRPLSDTASSRPKSLSSWQVLLILAALAAVTWAVFAPVRHFEFVAWDDPLYVTDNSRVTAGLTWAGVWWALTTGYEFYWQPLTWLSHMLDVELYGLAPGGHHVTSLLIHIASTLLLFVVLRRMTGATGRSAFVAALFAVHPLHVESVAWVAERKDVLSTFFLMLTLLAYSRYVDRPGPGRYLMALGLYALGLMAKPMVVTLPLVLLLLDVWPLQRFPAAAATTPGSAHGKWRALSRLVAEKVPFLALSAVSSAMTFIDQWRADAVRDLGSFPLGLRAANAVMSYVIYVVKMVWPAGLAAFYPHPASMPPWWLFGGALILLIAVSAGALWTARRRPYVLVGWTWYLVTLVPVIGLVLVGEQARADRFTYVPLVGLFIVVAWGVPDLMSRWTRRQTVLVAAATLVVLGCAAAARVQVGYWKDNLTLWTRAAAVTAGNHRAHASLGIELAAAGRLDEAATHYEEAIRIVPGAADLHKYLGDVRERQGRIDEALAEYSTAVRLKPDYEKARVSLAALLERQGRGNDVIAVYEAAVRLAPGSAAARNSLGVALASQGRLDEGIRELQEAVRLDPANARACVNLGVALEKRGRAVEAIAEYSKATRLKPDYALAYHNLGSALASQGRLDEAVLAMAEALKLEPANADWHVGLALMLSASGEAQQAVQHLETALALNPGHDVARRALDDMARRGKR